VEFLYRDFRPNFRVGNQRARELGFYMQKYCGCVFSEQDRYQKQINRDKQKFTEQQVCIKMVFMLFSPLYRFFFSQYSIVFYQ
jgi:predicted adenine nucleotide alpha hydrolase (AANH) superfamily ATPase